jgi:hypothetical protein
MRILDIEFIKNLAVEIFELENGEEGERAWEYKIENDECFIIKNGKRARIGSIDNAPTKLVIALSEGPISIDQAITESNTENTNDKNLLTQTEKKKRLSRRIENLRESLKDNESLDEFYPRLKYLKDGRVRLYLGEKSK